MAYTDLIVGSFSKTSRDSEQAITSVTKKYNDWLADNFITKLVAFDTSLVTSKEKGITNFTFVISVTAKK